MVAERWFGWTLWDRLSSSSAGVLFLLFGFLSPSPEWGPLIAIAVACSAVAFVLGRRVGVVLTADAIVRSDALVTRGILWSDVTAIKSAYTGAGTRNIFVVTPQGDFVIAHTQMRHARAQIDDFVARVHELWIENRGDAIPPPRARWRPTYDASGRIVLRAPLMAPLSTYSAGVSAAFAAAMLSGQDVLTRVLVLAALVPCALVVYNRWARVEIDAASITVRRIGLRTTIDRADVVDVSQRASDQGARSVLTIVDGRRRRTVTLPAPISAHRSMLGEDPQFGLVRDWLRAELLASAPHADH